MAALVIDGKKVALNIQENLKKEVSKLIASSTNPGLAVFFDESAPLSKRYVELKRKASKEIGINIFTFNVQEVETQEKLIKLVNELNADSKINGIFIQFPLSERFDLKKVVNRVAPEKDIDGCGPHNLGMLIVDEPYFIPCISHGIIKMLEAYKIDLKGKHAVVVEKENKGKTLALLLLKKNIPVTICPVAITNLKEECLRADILCIAVGREKIITGEMIKNGAIVIDMGMNATSNGKIIGDIDFDTVKEKAAYITPVPGGAGPMTVAMLMHNTVLAAKLQNRIHSNA